ncbi:helix-turn-helix domain-containing protein [Tropicibacter naphthalenivorans]|uniref:HTH-type transcriptional regulator PuuR n=1 Tax=Tropicibacter naphthalenivorans TaxID=441103 RepID=A0A0P1G4B6_9RHOB|nr:helix-turn-helix transcriptional regulator [Tropicibacter naphthalenivorans]CUH76635.1 HTH-type transcriptional regulator PuuR [Tropicibacter naphthalenivorans]SMC64414.1 Helix-turn-helix domain-containing protein [Tropicibacter naphthalenivorans]
MKSDLTVRLAKRLAGLRAAKGWTLDQLAGASGVSRAALSRLENAEVSPSADVLDKLAHAHGMSLARLLSLVEDGFVAHIRRDDQATWRDGESGLSKRIVSPGTGALAGEVQECKLSPGSDVFEEAGQVEGLEYHLVMISGFMRVELGHEGHALGPGDVLRFRRHGQMRLMTAKGQGAKFFLFTLMA